MVFTLKFGCKNGIKTHKRISGRAKMSKYLNVFVKQSVGWRTLSHIYEMTSGLMSVTDLIWMHLDALPAKISVDGLRVPGQYSISVKESVKP